MALDQGPLVDCKRLYRGRERKKEREFMDESPKGNWVCDQLTNELDARESDPLMIGGPPEAALFGKLAKESDYTLSAVFIGSRKIDFIAKHHQPFA